MREPCGGTEPERAQSGDTTGRMGMEIAGLTRFARDARGSTAIEYALIGSLIFLVAAGGIRTYVSRVGGVYNQISAAVSQGN